MVLDWKLEKKPRVKRYRQPVEAENARIWILS
jgi:hypothetical protein